MEKGGREEGKEMREKKKRGRGRQKRKKGKKGGEGRGINIQEEFTNHYQ